MNRIGILLLTGLLAVSAAGCAENGQDSGGTGTGTAAVTQAAAPGELTVETEEGFDEDYVPVLKAYFSAIDKQDYESYKAAIYPPFFEKLTEYYQKQNPAKTMEQVFEGLHKKFDEDGYEGWSFTSLIAGYYRNREGVSSEQDAYDFLNAFKDGGMIDESFVEETKKAAKDMKNIKFTVYALYKGDADAVPAVNGQEILGIKTEDGVYLFG